MFHGSMVALVTPMTSELAVDYNKLAELVDWHIAEGTDGIVMLGTTGESPTITHEERKQIFKRVLEQVNSRIPVIAGTGTNATHSSIELTKEAMQLGVDACLLVVPYYNKPTQEGLYQHFRAIAKAVSVPQVLYNVPSRTISDLLPETVIRLAEEPNIIGIKEATGDISRVKTILDGSDNSIDLYSGDDKTCLECMLSGGKGVISVAANVVPGLMHELCVAAISGNRKIASNLNDSLTDLYNALGSETNPIPTKWALAEMGKIEGNIRLPLTTLSSEHHTSVRKVLQQLKLLRSESCT